MIFTDAPEINHDLSDAKLRQGPLLKQPFIEGWKCSIVDFGIEAQFLFFARGWIFRARVSAETLADPQRFRASILRQAAYFLSDRELSDFYAHNGLLQQLLHRARKELVAAQREQMEAAE